MGGFLAGNNGRSYVRRQLTSIFGPPLRTASCAFDELIRAN